MLAVVLAGFACAVIAPFLPARLRGATGWVLAIVPAGAFAWLLNEGFTIAAGEPLREVYRWAPSLDLALSFHLDGLSLLFALLISGIGALVVIYTGGYLGEHPLAGRFFAFLLAFMASMLGVVLADNLLLLFVFWELTSVTSYLLIGFDQHRAEARAAALQALLVTGAGGLLLLAGLILLRIVGGSFELTELIARRDQFADDPRLLLVVGLVLAGAFTKSAQFPFHFWLPNAMAAPTPASAYLHSSTMVKAGVYLLARLHPVLGAHEAWVAVVTTVGAITMVVGAYLALRETYYKRLLAYTTVSVLGLLTMLLGLGSALAIKAAVVFLIAHAFYKAALFLIAGVVDHETHERDVEKLGALARKMPIVALAAVLAGASMAGLAPTFGFLAKETLFEATLAAGRFAWPLAGASLLAALWMVTVAGLVAWRPFFGPAQSYARQPHNGPFSLWFGPLVLASLSVACGVLPNLLSQPLIAPAAAAILQEPKTVKLALWHGFSWPLALDVAAIAGGVALLAVIGPVRRGLRSYDPFARIGPSRWYEWGLVALNFTARVQTRFFQSGRLQYYLATIVVTVLVLVGGLFAVTVDLSADAFDLSDMKFYEAGLAVLILAAVAMAVHARSRLAAIAALGVVGYGVGMLYVLFAAPDLAITQFIIETLTVILFILVFHHLRSYERLSSPAARVRDGVLALGSGALMTLLVLLAANAQWADSISHYFNKQSYPKAHGRNVVNVILVDFRGIDTLGEITVLAIAALGVYSLLRLRSPPGEGKTP